MKNILKNILEKFGYLLMTKKRFAKVEEGPYIPDLDFHYLIKKVIDAKDQLICLDIGANVGQTTKKLKQYFPDATIYSFEPIKTTFDSLEKNVNGLQDVKVFNEAMGVAPGTTEVYYRPNTEWNSLVKELNEDAKNEGAHYEIVKINSVDNFVSEMGLQKIDILKSDTEGFEMQVMEGAKNALASGLINMLYVEVGFGKDDKQHTYWMDVVKYLEGYGYSFSGLFESSYGHDLKVYYANALFMSPQTMQRNNIKLGASA